MVMIGFQQYSPANGVAMPVRQKLIHITKTVQTAPTYYMLYMKGI